MKDVNQDTLILLGARASRVENQDAIDACIVGMLGDPKEVCIQEKFNLCDNFPYSFCLKVMFFSMAVGSAQAFKILLSL